MTDAQVSVFEATQAALKVERERADQAEKELERARLVFDDLLMRHISMLNTLDEAHKDLGDVSDDNIQFLDAMVQILSLRFSKRAQKIILRTLHAVNDEIED